jgi:hypothetical protein
MARIDCACESEVVTLVYSGQWPHRASETLRAHVAACPVCADVVTVAAAIDADAQAEAAEPVAQRLPASGTMWWRAQLRARQEAAREVARPITVAQAVGFAAGVGAIGLFLGASSSWLQRAVARLMGAVSSTAARIGLPDVTALAASDAQGSFPLLLVVGAGIVITSLIVALVVIRQE